MLVTFLQTYLSDEDFEGLMLSKYQTVTKLIDECIAFEPFVVGEEEDKMEGGLQVTLPVREVRRVGGKKDLE